MYIYVDTLYATSNLSAQRVPRQSGAGWLDHRSPQHRKKHSRSKIPNLKYPAVNWSAVLGGLVLLGPPPPVLGLWSMSLPPCVERCGDPLFPSGYERS